MRLAITMHFLVTSDTFHSIKCLFIILYSTISKIIYKAICTNLKEDELSLNCSNRKWLEI